MKCNQFLPRFELVSPCPFPTTITITPRAPTNNECPGHEIKQPDGEVEVILELWGMWSTLSLPSLPGSFLFEVIAPDTVISMVQIEQNCVLMLNWFFFKKRTVFFIRTVPYSTDLFEIELFLTFNCVKIKTIPILNWIVLMGTVWINWIVWNKDVFDD